MMKREALMRLAGSQFIRYGILDAILSADDNIQSIENSICQLAKDNGLEWDENGNVIAIIR